MSLDDDLRPSTQRQRPRPLAPMASSIKVKWSVVIVAAVAVTALMSQIGLHLGWPVWLRPIVAGALALLAVQFLAHGLTYPLRQMADAAKTMARGDYSRRVEASNGDEVGQLAEAFNQMSAELAESDRLQKEFISNASHELRTPVAALQSTLENLVDGLAKPDRTSLELMLAQSEHLGRLVNQLLDLSRLEAGSDQPARNQIDLGDLLNELAVELRMTHPLAVVDVKAPLGLRVLGDDLRLRQVFTNIIGNALRFSPHGSPVTVVASRHNGSVRVAVRDLGPGIPVEQRAKVFERFWQSDGSAPTGGGGAGLGLAISRRIIDQHLGSIEITDNQPSGACVVVSLPRIADDANALRRQPQS